MACNYCEATVIRRGDTEPTQCRNRALCKLGCELYCHVHAGYYDKAKGICIDTINEPSVKKQVIKQPKVIEKKKPIKAVPKKVEIILKQSPKKLTKKKAIKPRPTIQLKLQSHVTPKKSSSKQIIVPKQLNIRRKPYLPSVQGEELMGPFDVDPDSIEIFLLKKDYPMNIYTENGKDIFRPIFQTGRPIYIYKKTSSKPPYYQYLATVTYKEPVIPDILLNKLIETGWKPTSDNIKIQQDKLWSHSKVLKELKAENKVDTLYFRPFEFRHKPNAITDPDGNKKWIEGFESTRFWPDWP